MSKGELFIQTHILQRNVLIKNCGFCWGKFSIEKAYEIDKNHFQELNPWWQPVLVLLPGLLSNVASPNVLRGLNLWPSLATDYYQKGLRTGSLPPSPHMTHLLPLLKGPYSSLLSRATITAQSHLLSNSVGKRYSFIFASREICSNLSFYLSVLKLTSIVCSSLSH